MATYLAGTAYIQVVPTLKGFAGKVKSELAGMDISATGQVKVDVNKASMAAAEAQVAALAAKLNAARDSEADAAGKARVAEQKLQDLRDSGKAKAAQLTAAEEALATAHRKLAAAQAASAKTAEQHAAAQQKVKDTASAPAAVPGGMGDGTRDGDAYGGQFADSARKRIETALKALPAAKITADSSDADREMAGLRDQLVALSNQRIGIDLDAGTAVTRINEIKAQLDSLQNSPNAEVRVNAAAASAELARVQAEIDQIDGRHAEVDVHVDDHGSASQAEGGLGNVFAAGMRLGGLKSVIGVLATALAGLGAGAAVGAAGIGAMALGLSGVGGAVKAMGEAQKTAGDDAAKSASQQVSSANQIASAQDRVASAVASLENTRAQAADAAIRAEQQVVNAETNLISAQRSALRAQQDLNDARRQATRALQDLNFQVQDGALAQRQAVLDLEAAKQSLDSTLGDPQATQRQREEAQITFERAASQLDQLKVRNQRLADDKAKADAAGVEGSTQVVRAQEAVQSANDKVAASQQALANAVRDQTAQQRQSAFSIAQAQQGVIDAQRSLQSALASTGDTGSASMKKLNDAMAELSPAGQAFALFIDALRPKLDALKATAQGGLLPGLQSGIESLMGVFPQIQGAVGALSTAMGGFFSTLGQLMAGPLANFLTVLGGVAGPIMQQFAGLIAQLSGFFFQLIAALLPVAPIAMQVLGVLISALQPLIPYLAQIVGVLAGGLLAGFQALAPAIGPVGQALAALAGPVAALVGQLGGVLSAALQALVPVIVTLAPPLTDLINLIGGTLIGLIQMLAPVIAELMPPLAQVASLIVGGLSSAIQMLMPHLGQIVAVIGAALMGVLQALMPMFPPLIQAWLSIVSAVLPLIPALLQVVSALLPPLIGLIPVLVPLIVQIAESFAQIMPQLMPVITALIDGLLPVIGALMPLVTMVFGAIVSIISWALSTIVVPLLQNVVIPVIKWLADVIVWLANTIVKPMFEGIGSVIKWVWENVIKVAFDAVKDAVHNVGQAFSDAIDWIGRVWDRMKEIAAVPVNFVIQTVYNDGIRKVWNGIADFLGLGQLPEMQPIKFAGGGILPGYAPGRDVVPALLSPGESVLTPEATRAIGPQNILALNAALSGRPATVLGGFSGGGIIPRFAGGGIVDTVLGFVGNIGESVAALFKDPVGWIKSKIGFADSPWINQLAQAPAKLIDKAVNWLMDKLNPFTSGGGGGPAGNEQLSRWIRAAMSFTGVDASWFGPLSTLIMRESGGNPNAINDWDSNAQAGHPSQGLMQTIPGTFAAYRDQRLPNNITDPIANIVAGINYIRSRYGSIFNVQQAVGAVPQGYSGGGLVFDQGGWLPPGFNTIYNGLGRPEPLGNLEQISGLGGGLADLDGLPITGVLDLGDGFEARIDARIDMAGHSVGTAITTRRR